MMEPDGPRVAVAERLDDGAVRMAEIEGAREELDLAAESLRAELRRLAAQLTPARLPDLHMLPDPLIVDWHEPLRYQYRASARIERLPEQYDTTLVTRGVAAHLGRLAGHRRGDGCGQWNGADHRCRGADGFRVQVRVQRGYGPVEPGTRPRALPGVL